MIELAISPLMTFPIILLMWANASQGNLVWVEWCIKFTCLGCGKSKPTTPMLVSAGTAKGIGGTSTTGPRFRAVDPWLLEGLPRATGELDAATAALRADALMPGFGPLL